MTLIEILKNETLSLPIIVEGDFRDTIEKKLSDFKTILKSLDDEDIQIPNIHTQQPHAIKGILNLFSNGLLQAIDEYLNGKPASAFNIFSKTIEDFGREHLKIGTFPVDDNFYRIRINKSNYLFPPVEMFHVPFETRGIIKTQRYSIPGFPSLYLGRTLYGCWEEMRRPNINEFQAVRLSNIEEIKYLDLVPCIPLDNSMNIENYLYLMTWPLIACCSIKVKTDTDDFKPEYIIPQLLLQWVRNQNAVDGIRYNSTHALLHQKNNKGDFSNLVMPIKCIEKSGHCLELKKLFKISESVSWQSLRFATGAELFLTLEEDDQPLNNKISGLEIIPGRIYPYSYSELGGLERYLGYMPVKNLQ